MPGAGIDQTVIYRAQGVASGILRQAGVDLRWRRAEVLCVDHGIVVTISHQTPANHHPGALAYAMPFRTGGIVLLLDRIREVARPNAEPYVLGHVLADEVIHVLQGVDQHSTAGLMKPHWSQSISRKCAAAALS